MHLPLNTPLDVACVKSALIAQHAALSGMIHTYRMMGATEYAQVRAEADSTARMLLIVCEIERGAAEAPIETIATPEMTALPTIPKGTRVQMNRTVGHIAKGMIGVVSHDGHYRAVYVDFGLINPLQIVRDAFDILPETLDTSSFEVVQSDNDRRWRYVSHRLGLATNSWQTQAEALVGINKYPCHPAAMSEMAHNYLALFPITDA